MLTTIKQKHTVKNGALQITFYEWGLTLYVMKSILRSGWKGDFCFIYLFCLYPSFTKCNIIILFIVHYFIFVMLCYILIKLLNHFLHHFFFFFFYVFFDLILRNIALLQLILYLNTCIVDTWTFYLVSVILYWNGKKLTINQTNTASLLSTGFLAVSNNIISRKTFSPHQTLFGQNLTK